MSGNRRIVQVYEPVITYQFEGDDAFVVTESGRRQVPYYLAEDEILKFKMRDGRHYKHDVRISSRAMYWWLAALTVAVTIVITIWVNSLF